MEKHDLVEGSWDIEKYLPLKRIPVLRENYCSQNVADQVIDFYQNNNNFFPPLGSHGHMDRVFQFEGNDTKYRNYFDGTYSAFTQCLSNMERDGIEIPNSTLGLIDLTHELRRRLLIAIGWPDPIIWGKSFVEHIDGPYPDFKTLIEFTNLKTGDTNLKYKSYEIAECLYEYSPGSFYIAEEAIRTGTSYEYMLGYFIKLGVDLKKNNESLTSRNSSLFNIDYPNKLNVFRNILNVIGLICEIPSYCQYMIVEKDKT
jgi:hypothetical protein